MGCSFSQHKTYNAQRNVHTTITSISQHNMKNNATTAESSTQQDASINEEMHLYDVSISCHQNQLNWVETHLLSLLETKLNLCCFVLERDRPAGLSASEAIEESIKFSKQVIICFSRDYLASKWKQFEALMVHHTDPNGFKGTIIPIVLDDCELPCKYSGFSVLQWPSSEPVDYKANMKLQFFWTNLLRSLNVTKQCIEEVCKQKSWNSLSL